MIKNLKVPEERVGVIKTCISNLGKNTNVKISVEEGSVRIEGEPLEVWKAKDIMKAIARGFSPEKAFLLLDDDKMLCVMDLKDYENTEKGIKRIKGRIIGEDGKTRERIEEMAGCVISVYGKTVSVIADSEKMSSIKEGIEMLINGCKHNKVYNYFHGCLGEREDKNR